MQQERGLQAAEAWILYGAREFPDSFFDSLNGEWRYAFGWFGTVAAGGRFCGLKAALRSPSLHRYGSDQSALALAAALVLGPAWFLPLSFELYPLSFPAPSRPGALT